MIRNALGMLRGARAQAAARPTTALHAIVGLGNIALGVYLLQRYTAQQQQQLRGAVLNLFAIRAKLANVQQETDELQDELAVREVEAEGDGGAGVAEPYPAPDDLNPLGARGVCVDCGTTEWPHSHSGGR